MTLGLYEMRRSFGRKLALDGVTLELERGECYGLVGENGAGKTSLMRMALGLDPRGSGAVLVDGIDARAEPREARSRVRGLVEVPGAWVHLDGIRNLERLLRLCGSDRRGARARAIELLEQVGLSQVAREPVRGWSLGMRQRLGIASALAGEPRYLLLDEPLGHLDPGGIVDMRALLLAAVRERGLGLLVSSHQLVEVEPWCDRVGVLHGGRLLAEERLASWRERAVERVRLETADDAHTLARLQRGGWTVVGAVRGDGHGARLDGGLVVELGGRPTHELAREVVAAGCALSALVPERASLERVYLDTLRAAREGRAGDLPRPAPPQAPGAPRPTGSPAARATRQAPRAPLWLATRHELVGALAPRNLLLVIGLPCVLAALAARARHSQALDEARALGVDLASATIVTGFEGVAVALRAGLPAAALVLAGLASQAIAGELARGTLRNLLLAPIGRGAWIAGKAAAWLVAACAAWIALALTALVAAGSSFGFGDVVEVLPNGEPYPLVPASELWPMLRTALAAPALALAACGAIGFLAGALARGGASAIAASWGGLLALDLARAPARGAGLEAWLPTTYVASPLGDRSFLKSFSDAAQGSLDARFDFESSQWIVPLLWCLACWLGAHAVWLRRPVA